MPMPLTCQAAFLFLGMNCPRNSQGIEAVKTASWMLSILYQTGGDKASRTAAHVSNLTPILLQKENRLHRCRFVLPSILPTK
jgi:hypothetical protein